MIIEKDGQTQMNLYEPIFTRYVPDERLKTCRVCNRRIKVQNFRFDKRTEDGYATICRDCDPVYQKHIRRFWRGVHNG